MNAVGAEEKGRMGGGESGQNTRCTCMKTFPESISTDEKWEFCRDSVGE